MVVNIYIFRVELKHCSRLSRRIYLIFKAEWLPENYSNYFFGSSSGKFPPPEVKAYKPQTNRLQSEFKNAIVGCPIVFKDRKTDIVYNFKI